MSKRLLLIGAYMNVAIALLHVVAGFFGRDAMRFFSAPRWVIMASPLELVGIGIVMFAIFFVFALYAYSGAGRMRPLPFLRMGIAIIGGIYVLRGLVLIRELQWLSLGIPFPRQRLAFSAVALVVGVLYLVGLRGVRTVDERSDRNA